VHFHKTIDAACELDCLLRRRIYPSTLHEEISMVALRLATIAVGAACVLALANSAQARGPYDGAWTVSVQGRSGSCVGVNTSYNLQIVNGSVRYYGGDAQVSGRVSAGGAVVVRVVGSSGSGVGSGRLRGSTGGGTFRGHVQGGPCAGTWYGQRSG
jgi:hypothetical protein